MNEKLPFNVYTECWDIDQTHHARMIYVVLSLNYMYLIHLLYLCITSAINVSKTKPKVSYSVKRRAIFKIYVLYSYNWNSITKQCWSFGPTRGWGREGVWLNPNFQERTNSWNSLICKSTLFLCLWWFVCFWCPMFGETGSKRPTFIADFWRAKKGSAQ